MKKVLALILLLAVIIGAVKGIIYYKVTQQLDHAIALVSPFALITYKGVSSSLDGGVNVKGLKIKAYGSNMAITVDDIGVKFPDLIALLFVGEDLKKQRLPEQMKLTLRHVKVDLQSLQPYMSLLGAQSQQTIYDYTLLGCRELQAAPPLDALQQLGYSQIDSTFKLGYRWDKASKHLAINSEVYWHDLVSSAVTIDINQVTTLTAAVFMTKPEIKRISVSIEDEGYNTRFLNYCAAEQNISKEEFVDLHLELMKAVLAEQGISVSERVFDAYQYYLEDEGALVLEMRSRGSQSLANLSMLKPGDIPDLLELEIHMGDEVIHDFGFDWNDNKH